PPVDEPPAVGVKTSELFLNGYKLTRVQHCSFDFQAVSNDRRIPGELLNACFRIACHLTRIEVAEGMAIAFAFLQHDGPAQPGLCGFEHQEFKMSAIVVDRRT